MLGRLGQCAAHAAHNLELQHFDVEDPLQWCSDSHALCTHLPLYLVDHIGYRTCPRGFPVLPDPPITAITKASMPSNAMLAVPAKRAGGFLDLKGPIGRYLQSSFSTGVADQATAGLQQAQMLRNKAAEMSGGPEELKDAFVG